MSVLKMVVVAAMACSMAACGPGEMGPQGPQGIKGTPGNDGAGLTKIVDCYGFADPDGDGRGLNLYHSAYTFADGSVLATCEVQGGNISTSAMLMHRAGTGGARVGGCSALWDNEQNATSGEWDFLIDAGNATAKATYDDPGSQLHGRAFSLSCTLE